MFGIYFRMFISSIQGNNCHEMRVWLFDRSAGDFKKDEEIQDMGPPFVVAFS